MTRRHMLRALIGLAAAVVAAGCGKKGDPKAPDPARDKFPRKYPKPE